ncbi:MAG: protein kinase [Planctomyces sp.]|nr:protein kinase [Planctomyces sp.]
MKPSTECLEASQVDSLLLGNLTPEEYQAVQDHLESCETCRTRVETTIGPEQWWSDVQSVLRSHSSLHAAASLRAAGGFRVEEVNADAASLGETRLRESVLDLLGPTDDPNMLGRIGSYEIIGLLGQGGMGAVFKGFDRSLNRFVAIKMLLPHLAASGAARKRFAREGQAVAAVVDDHVMAIHCVDEWRGVPYLVMTYTRGCSLQKRLSGNGPLRVREILRIGMQAARGLAAAHAQGIVHRDIKPANIFLDQNVERVQLMDFGLARAVDDASLTRSGTLAGTPQYMSPEQARAETVDHRSDLFSLGSVMYAMCTGHAPFRAESSYSILRMITDKEPRPIPEINSDIPEWLCTIISKLMAKQASDRFGSAQEVARLLEDCLAHVQQPTVKKLPDSLIQHHLLATVSPRRAGLMKRFKGLGIRSWLLAGISVAAIMLIAMMLQDNGPNSNELKNDEAKAASDCAVVMVMHPAELRNGNTIQRAAAAKTLQLLTADDYCGILGYYSVSAKTDTYWLWGDGTALQKIGEDRDKMRAAIAESSTGDFPTLEPAFNMAVDAFQKVNTKQKLMIVFTDGTPLFVDATLIDRFRDAGIKVSVIHVDVLRIKERPLLKRLADETGGTYHYALASQANVVDTLFVREVQSLRSNSNAALQKIAVAFHMIHDKVGSFPGSRMKHLDRQENEFEHPYSWRVAILPYIGQQELFDKYRFDEPWDSDNNLALLSEMPEFYRSPHAPRDQRPGNTNLLGFATEQGGLGLKGGETMSSFTDGTSNTILIVETAHSVPWTKPEDLTESKVEPIAGHPLRFVLADGSVGEMNSIDTDNLEKMITRNGGEVIRIEPADNPKAVDESNAHAIDHRSARSVVEAYIELALAGDIAKAAALSKNSPADPKQIAEIPEFLNVQRLKIQTVYVNDPAKPTRALATSAAVKLDEEHKQPDGQRDGFMVFGLELTDDKWFVIDIDFESESGAEKELQRFLEANPKSIGLPPSPKN